MKAATIAEIQGFKVDRLVPVGTDASVSIAAACALAGIAVHGRLEKLVHNWPKSLGTCPEMSPREYLIVAAAILGVASEGFHDFGSTSATDDEDREEGKAGEGEPETDPEDGAADPDEQVDPDQPGEGAESDVGEGSDDK